MPARILSAKQADIKAGVARGGSWCSEPRDCRSAKRWAVPLSYRSNDLGFRVARSLEGAGR